MDRTVFATHFHLSCSFDLLSDGGESFLKMKIHVSESSTSVRRAPRLLFSHDLAHEFYPDLTMNEVAASDLFLVLYLGQELVQNIISFL